MLVQYVFRQVILYLGRSHLVLNVYYNYKTAKNDTAAM